MKRLYNKVLLTSILGNTLEYYEFSIFAVFALQIGKVFFTQYDTSLQIMYTLALFGAGFIGRPFGSVVFGHIGDKFGRRTALLITITGMSFATFAIGMMPSFGSIGVIAPLSLVFLRLLQGIFIGGEGAGSAVYILEHEMHLNKNIVSGILITSNVAGTILASIVGLIITEVVGLDETSWRYAFVFGGIIGLVVSYLRFSLPETQAFSTISQHEKPKLPFIRLFSKHWRQVLIVMAFGGFCSSISYIIKGYLPVYLEGFLKLPVKTAFEYLLYTSVVYAILPPIFALILNKCSCRTFIRITTLAIAIFYIPAFKLVSTGTELNIVLGLTGMAILTAAILTPLYIYFSDMFPAEIRFSGVAISYNIGITLVGGFTPLIATYLNDTSDLRYAPAFYIVMLSLLYLVVDYVFYKRQHMRQAAEALLEEQSTPI